jgi:N-acetylmuramoyl-L-alanine amidase
MSGTTPPLIEAPSPNHGPRRGVAAPDMVMLHYTAMATAEAALERLRDPEAEVSAHYLIAEDGRLWRLVPEDRRAWHAGVAGWGAADDLNSRSIGIELANSGAMPFTEPQMARLEALLGGILARHGIAPERVLGHQCTAPLRKIDPGPRFDWRRLAMRGLSIWLDWAG